MNQKILPNNNNNNINNTISSDDDMVSIDISAISMSENKEKYFVNYKNEAPSDNIKSSIAYQKYQQSYLINFVNNFLLHSNYTNIVNILHVEGDITTKIDVIERVQKARNIALLSLIVVVVAMLVIPYGLVIGYYMRVIIVCILVLLILMIMYKLKYCEKCNVRKLGNVFMSILYFSLLILILNDGGLYQPVFSALYVLPPTALAVCYGYERIIWCLAVIPQFILTYILHESGFDFPDDRLPDGYLVILLSYIPLYMWSFLCIYCHLLANDFFIEQMKYSLHAIETEKNEANDARQGMVDYISRMSHEFRSPLHVIMNLTELALTDIPNVELITKHLKDSLHVLKSLRNIVSDVLTFARSKHDDIDLNIESINIVDSVNSIISSQQKVNTRVNIISKISDDVGWVLCDGTRLFQILMNLVGNSMKFTHEGSIIVNVRYENINMIKDLIADSTNKSNMLCMNYLNEDDSIDKLLVFSVRDTGIGVKEEQLQRIFLPFVQADNTISRKYGGTGLGLNIVHQLIKRMKGCIWIQSETNNGFEFSFAVHFPKTTEPLRLSPSNNLMNVSLVVEDVKPLSEINLILIDDSKMNLRVTSLLLKRLGLKNTTSVNDGTEGINIIISSFIDDNKDTTDITRNEDQLTSSKFDVALIDLHMPGISGYEVASKLSEFMNNKKKKLKWLPLIAFTADVNASVNRDCQNAGFNSILTKPASMNDMRRMLLEILPQIQSSLDWYVPVST